MREELRRGVRAVEGARLESECRGNSTVGSNPTLSAILKIVPSRSTIAICATECYTFCSNCRALHSLAARKPDGNSYCLLPAKDRGNRLAISTAHSRPPP